MSLGPLTWSPRGLPLEVEGAVSPATGLNVHLLSQELSGVCVDGTIVVLGPAERLPWVDGIVYVGRESKLHLLYLPTNLVPSVPVGWLTQALQSQAVPGPWVLLPDNRVIGLSRAGSLDPIMLERLRARPSA